jgi:hypothetical protein
MGMNGTQWFSMGMSSRTGIWRRFVTQKLNRIEQIDYKLRHWRARYTTYGRNLELRCSAINQLKL